MYAEVLDAVRVSLPGPPAKRIGGRISRGRARPGRAPDGSPREAAPGSA
jgi:hypothetical protein